jgi:transcriptional/translational regulatory protein YebC/TACO1
MAGHSKWANIRHRKGAQDAKRGKLFTKLIREIVVAAKTGGGDADSNPRLRAAIDKALSANMTKDTIERAVKRGAGANDGENFDEVRYEGYGPNGVAIMVDCLTDEDKIMEAALEAGAEDIVTNDDGSIDVITAWEEFLDVKGAMVSADLRPEHAEITMRPSTSVDLEKDDAEKVMRLVDMLEDLDDVQNVYSNAEINDEILAQL